MKLSKQFSYFSGYLAKVQHDPVQARVETSMGLGCMGLTVAVPLLAVIGAVAWGLMPAIGMGLGALVFGGLGLSLLKQRMARPKSEAERTLQAAARATHAMKQLHRKRKLHRRLDPVALQLLEAGAYHWTRASKALEGYPWTDDRIAGHWRTARDHMRLVADQAMVDLVLLGQSCMGAPQRERRDDLRSFMGDLADLDIADALDGLRSIAGQDWTAYAHQSPQARIIFEPARQIAEGLKRLADEIEATTPMMVQDTQAGLSPSASTDSIDLVLGEVRLLRQAEDEVRNQQLGQG